jgi:hypothetical protein
MVGQFLVVSVSYQGVVLLCPYVRGTLSLMRNCVDLRNYGIIGVLGFGILNEAGSRVLYLFPTDNSRFYKVNVFLVK